MQIAGMKLPAICSGCWKTYHEIVSGGEISFQAMPNIGMAFIVGLWFKKGYNGIGFRY